MNRSSPSRPRSTTASTRKTLCRTTFPSGQPRKGAGIWRRPWRRCAAPTSSRRPRSTRDPSSGTRSPARWSKTLQRWLQSATVRSKTSSSNAWNRHDDITNSTTRTKKDTTKSHESWGRHRGSTGGRFLLQRARAFFSPSPLSSRTIFGYSHGCSRSIARNTQPDNVAHAPHHSDFFSSPFYTYLTFLRHELFLHISQHPPFFVS